MPDEIRVVRGTQREVEQGHESSQLITVLGLRPLRSRRRRDRPIAQDSQRAFLQRRHGVDPAGRQNKAALEGTVRCHPLPGIGTVPARRGRRADDRGEACHLQQVRHQALAGFKPGQRLPDRHPECGQGAERRQVEAVGGLIELHYPARSAGRISEPRVEALPPGTLMQEIDADEHDRPPVPQPVVDPVGVARKPETRRVLARKADLSAFDLGCDGETADLLVSVDEFDVAVDAEVTRGGVPDMPGIGHRLVDECFGAEARALLNTPRGHRQPRPRPDGARAEARLAPSPWPSTCAVSLRANCPHAHTW